MTTRPRVHLIFADSQKARIDTFCGSAVDLARDRLIPAEWIEFQWKGDLIAINNGDGWVRDLCGDCYKAWVESYE